MDVISNSSISGTLRNAKARSMLDLQAQNQKKIDQLQASALNRQLERSSFLNDKERGEAFEKYLPRNSRHQRTYLSGVDTANLELGAMRTPVTEHYYKKLTTPNKKLVTIKGKEYLNFLLENVVVSDRNDKAFGEQGSYVFRKINSKLAKERTLRKARSEAEGKLEHHQMLSEFASAPVGYIETRESGRSEDADGEIFLISEIRGMVSFPAAEIKSFDPASLNGEDRVRFDKAKLKAMMKLQNSGLTAGGIIEGDLEYDPVGNRVLVNPLRIDKLPEETVQGEYSELTATLAFSALRESIGIDWTAEQARQAYEQRVKYARGRHPVIRNALHQASKNKKEPWKDAVDRVLALSPSQ